MNGLLVMLTRLYMLGRLGGFIRLSKKCMVGRINNFGTRIQNCCLILLGGLTVRIRKAKIFSGRLSGLVILVFSTVVLLPTGGDIQQADAEVGWPCIA